jgi:hypothetical protein
MVKYVESLAENIKIINPEKILFVCSTNKIIVKEIRMNNDIIQKILTTDPLPYPGVGWLRRPDKKGLIDLLPSEYKLSARY